MNPYETGCAWVEGTYCPISEARIPILDQGFTHSDLTHDVVAVWKGKFFRLEEHLDRFTTGWRRLRMNNPGVTRQDLREILFECVRRTGLRDAYVQMIMTRGINAPGVRDPRLSDNRLYVFAIPYVWILKPEDQEAGIHLVLARDTVRIAPESVDPTVKNFHWGDLVRGLLEAYDRGGFTTVLPNADGKITEGPGFNLFAYRNGVLLTPAHGVLEGITRRTVLELAEEEGIATELCMFGPEVLRDTQEIFITSTAGGVMAVTILDDEKVGNGKPGPVTSHLANRYWEAHDEDRWTTAVDYEA